MLPIIEGDRISLKYGQLSVLEEISFAAESGDYIALVGPNGSGKTSLLKILLGLIQPESGEARLFGTPLAGFRDWRKVGYLPQNTSVLNPGYPATVKEIVLMGALAAKSFPKRITAEDRQRSERAMETTGIAELAGRLIGELSGGQRQRVMLARAIINEPELLLLDEPSTALDQESRHKFYALLHDLNRHKNTTIVLITHDLSEVGRHAGKILFIDTKLLFYGDFNEFCHSKEMENAFGFFTQHAICHHHDAGSCPLDCCKGEKHGHN